MADFEIRVESLRVEVALRAAEGRCKSLWPAWLKIGRDLVSSVRKNFAVRGRPEKWEPLSTEVRLGRKRKEPKRRLRVLLDSGTLRDSITFETRGDGVDVGSNLVYAATHQFGRDAIPARPFLVVQDEDEDEMVAIIERHIGEALR